MSATPLLTVAEVSARLNIPEATVRHWLREGTLVGVRLPSPRSGWRINERELRKFLKARSGPSTRLT